MRLSISGVAVNLIREFYSFILSLSRPVRSSKAEYSNPSKLLAISSASWVDFSVSNPYSFTSSNAIGSKRQETKFMVDTKFYMCSRMVKPMAPGEQQCPGNRFP